MEGNHVIILQIILLNPLRRLNISWYLELEKINRLQVTSPPRRDETSSVSSQSVRSAQFKRTSVAAGTEGMSSHRELGSIIDAEVLCSPVQEKEAEEEEGREVRILAGDQEQTYASEFSSSDEQETPPRSSVRREDNVAYDANCDYTYSLSEEDEKETRQLQHVGRRALLSQERPWSRDSNEDGQKKESESSPVVVNRNPEVQVSKGLDYDKLGEKEAELSEEEEEEEDEIDASVEDAGKKKPSPELRSPPPPSRSESAAFETLESLVRPETESPKIPFVQVAVSENCTDPLLARRRHAAARSDDDTPSAVAMATGEVDQGRPTEIIEGKSELKLAPSEPTTKLPRIKPTLPQSRVCQKRRNSPPLVSARRKFVQPLAAHRVLSARCLGSTSPEHPEGSCSESCNLQSGTEVRELAYKIWYQRQSRFLRASRQKELEDLKKEEAKIEEVVSVLLFHPIKEMNRLQDSQRVFLMWKEKKEQQLAEERRKRKAAEAQKLKAERKAEEQKEEAQRAFLAWRKSKEQELKKKTSCKPTDEAVDEITRREEKTKEAKAAYEAWQKQKDAELKARLLAQKLQKQKEEERKREERAQRRQAARDSYIAWELRKVSIQTSASQFEKAVLQENSAASCLGLEVSPVFTVHANNTFLVVTVKQTGPTMTSKSPN
ncbi:unnamed protein product [Schistocephalus solidus]|uniref:Coiled-coil domain-containing protein 181 n=1 Tax=Schistocephalus solidus TaxID=70667 RepID=A0A183T7J1_SCHSO|nr:unnamed protein product [Schistocephalus solidus]